MKVIYSLSEAQIKQLHHLYQFEWWTKDRSLQDTRKVIEGSQVTIGLIDEKSNLQGFARVITDFTFKALIFDIIISKENRNMGLAKKLIHLIKTHAELKEVQHFELYCHPDLIGFYEQNGFTSDIDGIQLMRLNNTSSCAQKYQVNP